MGLRASIARFFFSDEKTGEQREGYMVRRDRSRQWCSIHQTRHSLGSGKHKPLRGLYQHMPRKVTH